jgi:hypothetical protein
MIWKPKALGIGNCSRKGAKSPSSEEKIKIRTNDFDQAFSDLCGHCAPSASLRTCFAGDTPSFGCGLAALG